MKYLVHIAFFVLIPFLLVAQKDSANYHVLLSQLQVEKEDTAKVSILIDLSNEFVGIDNDKGLDFANQAAVLSKRINDSHGLAKAYYNKAKCFYYVYAFDSIDFYYSLFQPISELEINYQIAANFEYIAGLAHHIQSEYGEAIKHYTSSLKINQIREDKEGTAYCYNDIGAAYYDLGNYEKALENYFLSLSINEDIDNQKMVASTLANIGGIFEEQEKFESAQDYYFKANIIARELDEKQTIADTYRNIGGIYAEKELYDSTLIVYNKALNIYQEIGDVRGMVVLYNYFGQTYSELKVHYDSIILFYEKSLKLNNQEVNDVSQKISSYIGIAEVYNNRDLANKALPYLNKALVMAKEIESLDNIKRIHDNLRYAYSLLGDYRQAYENMVAFKDYSDSLRNDENIELLTQTSMQYEFDKQQKEQEFIQAQKDLEYQQKQKQDKLIRSFILAVLIIVIGFSIQVLRGYQRKKKDNILLEKQNIEIEKQKEEITDSIKYAKRIQTAILPSDDWATEHLPEHFIMFRPRDIVSGDYYWMNKIDNKVIIVAADCTGHGVPGAFMSMLGVSFLNEIVNKNNTVAPHLILNQLRNQVKRTLGQTGKSGEAKDGMDIALCVLDLDNMMLEYAGAYNPLYLYRRGELLETKADKMPIGIHIREKESFTHHEIPIEAGDTFYIFSDGFADQFGGPKGGKFKTKAFKDLLAEIQPKSMAEQWEILETTIDDWRGDIDQIDDMIIVGIRV